MGRISRRAFHGTLASAFAWSAVPRAWADPNRQTSVALLLSGVITDGGWSQLAYNGLKELKARYGFKTAYAENISIAQMDQVARGYSDDGFDLRHRPRRRIQQHPARSGARLSRPALFRHHFPSASREVPRNIMFVNMGYFGAAYGAGVLAALISEKKRAVGFIGGDDDPNQNRMKKAFIAGAQQTVPGIRALGDHHGRLRQRLQGPGGRFDPDRQWRGRDLARGRCDGPRSDPGRGGGKCKSHGLLFGPDRSCSEQHGDKLRDESRRNGDQRFARGGGRHVRGRHRVAASRESDVAAEMRQEWGL